MIKDINKEELMHALKTKYVFELSDEKAEEWYNELINNGSNTFRQNLIEWMHGEPFSDITVHDYNINKILDMWIIKDPLIAIMDLSYLEEYGEMYKHLIIQRWKILV